jgi:hypothetical protein
MNCSDETEWFIGYQAKNHPQIENSSLIFGKNHRN